MALAVNTTFAPCPSYFKKEVQPAGDKRPFSYLSRPRAPHMIRKQPCVDSDIYFSTPNVSNPDLERPPPRPPRSPKVSRMAPHRPPRSPMAGRAHLFHTKSESDLHSHIASPLTNPNTPPPRSPSGMLGSKQSKQTFFPPENEPPPRSPRIPPRSYHAPESPAVPPRSPRLPPKPTKLSHFSPTQHQPLTGRSVSNRSDRSDRCHSSDPRVDFRKMTRQTSADTVRIVAQNERELRSAPPPPVLTSAITEQPRQTRQTVSEETEEEQPERRGPRSKRRSEDRETFELEKKEEKEGCCHHCARICVNDGTEFCIELFLD